MKTTNQTEAKNKKYARVISKAIVQLRKLGMIEESEELRAIGQQRCELNRMRTRMVAGTVG